MTRAGTTNPGRAAATFRSVPRAASGIGCVGGLRVREASGPPGLAPPRP